MKTSLVIPTLNEAGNIADVLKDVPKDIISEILVVDGYSTDGTPEIVKKLGYNVIMQDGKGYGAGFLTGIKHATGDVVVLMDGDGSQNPKDIPLLIDKINEGYDFVLASRYTKSSCSEDDTVIRHIGNKFFTFLTNFIHGMGITDSLYLFAAFQKRVLDDIDIKTQNFEFCVEVIIKAYNAGFKFCEVPSVEKKRAAGQSKVNAFYHGLRIMREIIRD